MAIAKFSDWLVNEMGEPLPTAGEEQPTEEQVKRQLSQFKSNFDRLMTQIKNTPTINKDVVRTMLDEIITELQKAKGLSGKEKTGMQRLGAAVHGARV